MPRSPASRTLILLAFLAFISLGLPDTLLGVAWPSIRDQFDKPISYLGLLLGCATTGYVTSSFFAGSLMHRLGVGKLLVGSCVLVTMALSIYAFSPLWPLLFAAALIGGLGAGAIDAGVNTFASNAFTPRILNWLHGCWGIGATLGPIVMTATLSTHHGWRLGYLLIGITMLCLTIVFAFTSRLWEIAPVTAAAEGAVVLQKPTLLEAVRERAIQGHVLFYFLYCGVESSAGNWIVTLLTESRGVSIGVAGATASCFWGSLTVGRLVFGQLAHAWGAMRVMRIGLFGAMIGAALTLAGLPVWLTIAGAALMGFSLAPLFPTLIAMTPARVGERFAAHSVGLQIAAAGLGMAIVPGLIGVLARRAGIEILPPALLLGTILIFLLHEGIARLPMKPAPRATPGDVG